MSASARSIAVDWGTSSFRAYLRDGAGAIVAERRAADGISKVPPGGFPAVLESHIGDWRQAHPGAPVIMAGMVGSRNGWIEAPYAPLPAGPADLRARLTRAPIEGGEALIVPGLSTVDRGLGDVMRGEETLALGAGVVDGVVISPGTHPKWIVLEGGRIVRFATFMSGEVFALLTEHSLLARLAADPLDEADEDEGFARGLAAADDDRGLLHAIFAARADVLLARMPPSQVRAFLSGVLVGSEASAGRRMLPGLREAVLIAAGRKAAFYRAALDRVGIGVRLVDSDDAMIAGLDAILSA
jgi:2-dehydro-3-deoxygalactonokinase